MNVINLEEIKRQGFNVVASGSEGDIRNARPHFAYAELRAYPRTVPPFLAGDSDPEPQYVLMARS